RQVLRRHVAQSEFHPHVEPTLRAFDHGQVISVGERAILAIVTNGDQRERARIGRHLRRRICAAPADEDRDQETALHLRRRRKNASNASPTRPALSQPRLLELGCTLHPPDPSSASTCDPWCAIRFAPLSARVIVPLLSVTTSGSPSSRKISIRKLPGSD